MKSESFDKYVVGEGNKFTHAVLETVLEEPPGKLYNPVIISGLSGVGKTFSVRRVADAFQKMGKKVRLTSCVDWISELMEDLHCEMNRQYRKNMYPQML